MFSKICLVGLYSILAYSQTDPNLDHIIIPNSKLRVGQKFVLKKDLKIENAYFSNGTIKRNQDSDFSYNFCGFEAEKLDDRGTRDSAKIQKEIQQLMKMVNAKIEKGEPVDIEQKRFIELSQKADSIKDPFIIPALNTNEINQEYEILSVKRHTRMQELEFEHGVTIGLKALNTFNKYKIINKIICFKYVVLDLELNPDQLKKYYSTEDGYKYLFTQIGLNAKELNSLLKDTIQI